MAKSHNLKQRLSFQSEENGWLAKSNEVNLKDIDELHAENWKLVEELAG